MTARATHDKASHSDGARHTSTPTDGVVDHVVRGDGASRRVVVVVVFGASRRIAPRRRRRRRRRRARGG